MFIILIIGLNPVEKVFRTVGIDLKVDLASREPNSLSDYNREIFIFIDILIPIPSFEVLAH
jgi:hypothetical protein